MAKRSHRSQSIRIPIKIRKRPKKTPFQTATLKIGEVSKKTGIPVVTLRFYEKSNLLLTVAEKKNSAHRRFSSEVYRDLDLIAICRKAGFSIPETRDLMRLYRGFKLPSKAKMTALRRSIEAIREQKRRLSQLERILLHRQRHPEGLPTDFEDDADY